MMEGYNADIITGDTYRVSFGNAGLDLNAAEIHSALLRMREGLSVDIPPGSLPERIDGETRLGGYTGSSYTVAEHHQYLDDAIRMEQKARKARTKEEYRKYLRLEKDLTPRATEIPVYVPPGIHPEVLRTRRCAALALDALDDAVSHKRSTTELEAIAKVLREELHELIGVDPRPNNGEQQVVHPGDEYGSQFQEIMGNTNEEWVREFYPIGENYELDV